MLIAVVFVRYIIIIVRHRSLAVVFNGVILVKTDFVNRTRQSLLITIAFYDINVQSLKTRRLRFLLAVVFVRYIIIIVRHRSLAVVFNTVILVKTDFVNRRRQSLLITIAFYDSNVQSLEKRQL